MASNFHPSTLQLQALYIRKDTHEQHMRASQDVWAGRLERLKQASHLHVEGLQHELELFRAREHFLQNENAGLKEAVAQGDMRVQNLEFKLRHLTLVCVRVRACACACVRVRVCVRAFVCMRTCAFVCVRVLCVCVYVCVDMSHKLSEIPWLRHLTQAAAADHEAVLHIDLEAHLRIQQLSESLSAAVAEVHRRADFDVLEEENAKLKTVIADTASSVTGAVELRAETLRQVMLLPSFSLSSNPLTPNPYTLDSRP